jgi:hypothetical protein
MQDLKQKLADQGLAATLTILATGQKIPLRFTRGETSKLCKVELGPTSVLMDLALVPVEGAAPGEANLALTLAVHDAGAEVVPGAADAEAAAAAEKAAAEAEAAAAAEKAAAEAEAAAAEEKTKSSVSSSSYKSGGDKKGK